MVNDQTAKYHRFELLDNRKKSASAPIEFHGRYPGLGGSWGSIAQNYFPRVGYQLGRELEDPLEDV